MVKTVYEKLKKKYKLPDYNKINNEFEISAILDKDFLLREIRRKIYERLESYIEVLSKILHPEAELISLYEAAVFTEQEKEKIFKLFKQLMVLNRYSIETSINENDKKTAKFINKIWKEWDDIKNQFSDIIARLKEDWLKEEKTKEKVRYLG